MAESYVRTAIDLRDLGELAFFARFGGEAARVCLGFPELKTDDVARKVFELHQRHGQAIWRVLKDAVENHSAELLQRSLPPSSVLMMTVVPGAMPTLAIGCKPADPLVPLIKTERETTTRYGEEPATAGHETKAIKALALYLKDNPNSTRAAAADWCRKSRYKLGTRAFDRVWPQARETAGLERIGAPGRKRKSRP